MVDFSFIVQTGEPGLPGGTSIQQSINSHVARHTHKQRRENTMKRFAHIDSATRNLRNRRRCAARPIHHQLYPAAAMLRVPKDGGYDPFATFGRSCDYRINELLTFERKFLASLLGSTNHGFMRQMQDVAWQMVLKGLRGTCSANAFLASAATMYGQFTGSNVMVELGQRSRGRALAGLRKRLSTKGFESDIPICVQTVMCADLCARDFDAALFHSQYLARIVLNDWPEGARHSLLWSEIHRAVSTLTRPTLNLAEYPKQPGVWLPSVRAYKRPVLDKEALGKLYNLYEELTTYQAVIEQLLIDGITPTSAQIIRFSTSLLLLEGQLLNFSIEQSQHNDPLLAAAALAALYYLRLMTRDECMYGYLYHERIYAAAPVIVQRMEILLKLSPDTAHSACDKRLLLWTLYVGSFIEERTGGTYHQRRLAKVVSGDSCSDALYEIILSKFLPLNDDMERIRPIWLFPPLRCYGIASELGVQPDVP